MCGTHTVRHNYGRPVLFGRHRLIWAEFAHQRLPSWQCVPSGLLWAASSQVLQRTSIAANGSILVKFFQSKLCFGKTTFLVFWGLQVATVFPGTASAEYDFSNVNWGYSVEYNSLRLSYSELSLKFPSWKTSSARAPAETSA